MGHENIVTALNEMEVENARVIFQDFMRDSVRKSLARIMAEEVTLLCGPKYFPIPGGKQRAGSEVGIFYDRGVREKITRPRVKGKSGEVQLKTYSLGRDIGNITEELLSALENGVSTRGYSKLKKTDTVSKSEISRKWIANGLEEIEKLRSRDLSQDEYFGLTLDGIHLSDKLMAIIAVGYLSNGNKKILDFNVGSSENLETSEGLVSRIVKRGFKSRGRLFCALDGSSSLKKSILKFFPDAVIQRCLVHKERNLKGYLIKSDHGECARLMNRLRKAEGYTAGKEALEGLKDFLKSKNKQAYNSLLEAGEELIALHKLNVPSTLNISLLSTNIIENTMLNLRRQIDRNCRWRPETDQADRWLASGLLIAEKGYRKIKGYKDIPKLMESLKKDSSSTTAADKKVESSPKHKQPAEKTSSE